MSRSVIVADFETTTDPLDCRVWAWGMAYIDRPMDVEIDDTLEHFIERISMENCVVYFHNLRFDGTFILDYLLREGYQYSNEKWGPKKYCFTTLISDLGQFYTIKVNWGNGFSTEFRDSYKKLPFTVARIATAFKLGETKGDLDYTLPRPKGWIPTPEERDYIRRDVSIVAQALAQTLSEGHTKLTVGSDALTEYKNLTPQFAQLFPILNEDIDAEIRRAYRGGFTYAAERYRAKHLGAGIVLDVNSLYPSVMYNRPLPYGLPDYLEGYVPPKKDKLSVFAVTFTAKLKKNHIPCIQVKNNVRFRASEYVSEIREPVELVVTEVDWALYNDHYDIKVIEYGGTWQFNCTVGMFKTYIDKWSEIKANSTGALRELAKLMLNSLYGKFASNPNVTGKYPVMKDNAVHFVRGPEEMRDPIYTAVGVFITAWARDYTIRSAQANYDTFAYADTDSLHLLQTHLPEDLEIHPTKLGAWKHEYNFTRSFYMRAKAYMELADDGEIVTHIAGVPENVAADLTFDDLVPGKVLLGKLVPHTVPGGVVLKDTPYRLDF